MYFLLRKSIYNKEHIIKMCAGDTRNRFHQSPMTTRNEIRSFLSGKLMSTRKKIRDVETSIDKKSDLLFPTIIPSDSNISTTISELDNTIISNETAATINPNPIIQNAEVQKRSNTPPLVPSVSQLMQMLIKKFAACLVNHYTFCSRQSVKKIAKLLHVFYNIKDRFQ